MLNYFNAFLPIICLGINISCQVFISRQITEFSLLKSVILGFAIGLFTLLVVDIFYVNYLLFVFREAICHISLNLVSYSALGYCYFHFINLGETARRIRLLRELYDGREGLSTSEILKRYNARDIRTKRLKRLIDNSQVTYREKKYYIGSPSMLLMAKLMVAIKLLVLGKRSEFDR